MAQKNARINFAVSGEEREAWRACAERDDLTLSEWIRRAAQREVSTVLLHTARRSGFSELVGAGR